MARVVVRINEQPEGYGEYCRSAEFMAHLMGKAGEFVATAKGIFLIEQHGKEEGPTFYLNSFYIKPIPWVISGAPGARGYAFRVGNVDDIANLVEFGAHTGGGGNNEFILGYHIFGKTMDVLEVAHG